MASVRPIGCFFGLPLLPATALRADAFFGDLAFFGLLALTERFFCGAFLAVLPTAFFVVFLRRRLFR